MWSNVNWDLCACRWLHICCSGEVCLRWELCRVGLSLSAIAKGGGTRPSLTNTCFKMGETLLEKLRLQKLKAVRLVILMPLFLNLSLLGVAVCAAILMWDRPGSKSTVSAVVVLAVGAFLRVAWLAVIGCAQAATASAMIAEKPVHDLSESNNKSVENDRRVSSNTA